MSHEIRTPLTAILGYTDMLHEDGAIENAPTERVQAIDTIKRAGEHLLVVINDILDLSKIEAGKMTVEHIATPLAKVLCDVERLMRPRAEGKGVVMTMQLLSPIPDRILSDPTRLRQILMNLVGNATKFTESGQIDLRIATEQNGTESRLRIEIEDTGSGMSQEQVAYLFRSFTQADSSITRKFGGSGLGLVICRRLAEMMGGGVELAHTSPGVGSCFVVELPLVADKGAAMVSDLDNYISALEAAEGPQKAGAKRSLQGRILLAEDGADNQRLISFFLRKAGAEVDVAVNGLVALQMTENARTNGEPYDLLVSDMQMPEMDGYTLAMELRGQGDDTPIIALTAHAMSKDRQRCLDAGCDDYASKPVNRRALIAACAKWIEVQRDKSPTDQDAEAS